MPTVHDYINYIFSTESDESNVFAVDSKISFDSIIKAKRKYGSLTKMYIAYCNASYTDKMVDKKTGASYYRKQTDELYKKKRKKPNVDKLILDVTAVALGQLVICWTAESKQNYDNTNLYKVWHNIIFKESPEAIKQYRSNKDLRLQEQLFDLIKKFWFYCNKIEEKYRKDKARPFIIKVERDKKSHQYEILANFIAEMKHNGII